MSSIDTIGERSKVSIGDTFLNTSSLGQTGPRFTHSSYLTMALFKNVMKKDLPELN
jgi:hypothetical protein